MQLSDGLGLTCSPLSYGQQALWFLYQMAPESVAYNIFLTVRITSELNSPAFYRIAQKNFECHPILRTTYTTDSGKPIQHAIDNLPPRLRETFLL
ncbi:MAG TPA: condensation domain-containing protein [Allocoleopsis sp.]